MKKALTTIASALVFLCVGSGVALAQDEETEELNWVPVETFACDFIDGKGPADLRSELDELLGD